MTTSGKKPSAPQIAIRLVRRFASHPVRRLVYRLVSRPSAIPANRCVTRPKAVTRRQAATVVHAMGAGDVVPAKERLSVPVPAIYPQYFSTSAILVSSFWRKTNKAEAVFSNLLQPCRLYSIQLSVYHIFFCFKKCFFP